jgi:hypothetical protein
MTKTIGDIRHFRRKAAVARQDAHSSHDAVARQLLTAMANFYDRLADHYERDNAPPHEQLKAG